MILVDLIGFTLPKNSIKSNKLFLLILVIIIVVPTPPALQNESLPGTRYNMDSERPMHMEHKYLEEITDGFADERELGRGTFGVVYKVYLAARHNMACPSFCYQKVSLLCLSPASSFICYYL